MNNKTFRYPGTKSFTSNDCNLYFGRDEDIIGLANLISLENIIVLYGKSGYGKTSLLNAGVIPYLKENGNLLTFQARFGAHISENTTTPIKHLLNNFQSNENRNNFIYDKIIPKDEITYHKLWYLFKEIQIANPEKSGFIIVFDQFEELFTYPSNQKEQFKKELSELLNVKVPQQVRNILKDKLLVDKDYLSEDEIQTLFKPLNVKIVISIRSDKMSYLNSLKDYFPEILQKTYELNPFTIKQAEDAIIKPSKIESNNFASPTFSYSEDALNKILSYLSNDNNQKIEAFQLQVICQFIENLVIEKNIQTITPEHLGDIRTIYTNFYNSIVNKTPIKEQRAVRLLIEEGLIFEDEERRLSLYENQIYREYQISPATLQFLVNSHLLRAEPSINGGFNYELSHDSLIKPIKASAIERNRMEEIENNKKNIETIINQNKTEMRNYLKWLTVIGIFGIVITCFLTNKYRLEKQIKSQIIQLNSLKKDIKDKDCTIKEISAQLNALEQRKDKDSTEIKNLKDQLAKARVEYYGLVYSSNKLFIGLDSYYNEYSSLNDSLKNIQSRIVTEISNGEYKITYTDPTVKAKVLNDEIDASIKNLFNSGGEKRFLSLYEIKMKLLKAYKLDSNITKGNIKIFKDTLGKEIKSKKRVLNKFFKGNDTNIKSQIEELEEWIKQLNIK